MRIVLDTNVVVSGILSPHGPPGRIADLAVKGDLQLLYDDRILAEYREVLGRAKFALNVADVAEMLGQLERTGEAVSASPLSVSLHAEDDLPFLEVAAAGAADALVTGNAKDFKVIRDSHNVRVISPRKLMDELTGRRRRRS
ncbi:MAG: putative toxin-antitoxin system toxin component, PIN family [Gemmatimonadetes bacterium]|nr:putative toxin-antitoxin system toxin component, PIN family [Gemmatimonadota bacterium]